LSAFLRNGKDGQHESESVLRYRIRGGWRSIAIRSRWHRSPDGGRRAVLFCRDVTDRENALYALRRSDERHQRLIEATHDLIAEVDAEGRVVFVSPSSREVLGLEPEAMVGTTPFSLLHPDDVENLTDMFLGRLSSDREAGTGAVFRVRHADGAWRWLEGRGINFETAEGETHLVAVARDVSERVEAARAQEQLVQRVEQARRFESLGMLATGVAHDFNNLLTPILGTAALALMDLPTDSPVRSRLERIQRASSEAAALTNQLLEYAGMGALDVERVDLPHLLAGLEEPLRGTIGRRAGLSIEHAGDPPLVDADAAQLGQLVLHLASNAVDAVDPGRSEPGSVVLRTGRGTLDEEALVRLSVGEECRPGAYAWLEVEDDGVGMDDSTRARIFDPFFTTKVTGRGLGLSVVLGVVRKHRGAIEFETEKGRGTRIRIWIPEAASA
jgi:PAS domain S-box-containing protein